MDDALTVQVGPADVTGTLVYVSSNESVATVSADGVVTAVAAGTAKITAKVGETVSNEITITVNDPTPPESSSENESSSEENSSVAENSSTDTNASSTDENTASEGSGCSSSVFSLVIATPVLLGAAAIVLKKKED